MLSSAARNSVTKQSVERFRFNIGGIGFLCPQWAVRELAPRTSISRVPNTAEWMRGLMNIRGDFVPVVDVALVLGSSTTTDWAYVLVVDYEDSTVALPIETIPVSIVINEKERVTMESACPEILRAHVSGAYMAGGQVWFDIDIQGILRMLCKAVANQMNELIKR